jgi:hypothetical protein
MTAPTGWWCPNCGHTVDAVVGAQPHPEPPCSTANISPDGQSVIGGSTKRIPHYPLLGSTNRPNAPVGVPVGDDTPAPESKCGWCGHPKSMHGDPELPDDYGWCQSPTGGLMLAPDGSEKPCGCLTFHEPDWTRPSVPVPVGDDAPLPPGVERTDDGWVLRAEHNLPTTWEWQDDAGEWVRSTGRSAVDNCEDRSVRPVGVPVGDDTPTPTAADLVDRIDAWCDEANTPREYEARALLYESLRRAGATPDLTALPTAEQAYNRALDNGAEVCSHFRLGVEDVLAAVAALVRSAQNDTDGGTDAD